MIRIEGLDKSFGKLAVLKNINLSFERGQIISLIGPNGSGKTTLIKCILGLVMPDHGKIFFGDKNILGSWDYRSQIGYMPQIGRYPEQMQIQQIFSMMRDLRSTHHDVDEELIHSFQLPGIFKKRMGTLSGGTRQKVSASLSFLFNPDMMILDEPTAGLDPLSAEILKNKILKEKANNKLTLITSHNMSEVEELADRIIFIVDGDVKFFKTVGELKSETGENKLGKALAKITGS
ncbi:MAG: ABC transporter ATP-binding protein [Bacteroidetes bacterium]|nr:ABC transporter ATP-binding protein [Bacteroidota bacterium]